MKEITFVNNEDFDDYVNAFKKLRLEDKEKIVESELVEIMVTLEQLNIKNNISKGVLYNREILDLKKDNYSRDDYVEAIFVYANAIKELIGNYVNYKEGDK